MANAWSLLVRMQGDVRQMEYALSSVERKFGGLAGTMSRTGRTMSAAGRAMTIGVTAPILLAGGSAIKAAADFEQSFTSIAKVLSDEDLKKAGITLEELSDAMRKMAMEIPIEGGVNILNQVAARGGALGIQADRIVEFTEVMAKLSLTADDLTVEAAATSFGHLNTVLNFTEGQIRDTADAIVELGNNGASTEGQILAMMSSIAGAGAIVGLSHTQMAAWGAAMANIGESAQAGGTSLSRFFQNMSGFITQGGDELEWIADKMGMTQKAVKDAFGKDSNQFLVDFMNVLAKLPKTKWIDALELLGLGDIRRRRAFTKLLEAIVRDSGGSLNAVMDQVEERQGAMQTEWEKRAATLNERVRLMGQKLNEYLIRLGEALMPFVEDDLMPMAEKLVGWVEDAVEWFSKLPEPVRKGAGMFALLAAAAGPLLFIFGGVFQFLGGIIGILQKIGGGALRATLVMLSGLSGGRIGGGRLGGTSVLGRVAAGGTPVFVTNWPPGLMAPGAGGPGGVVGGAAKGGFWSTLWRTGGRLLGVGFVAYAGIELGKLIAGPIYEKTVQPAIDYERSQLQTILDSNDPARIQRGIDVLDEQIASWESRAPQVQQTWSGLISTLKAQREDLVSALGRTGPMGPFDPRSSLGQFSPENLGGSTTSPALEELQRNIPKLATDDMLRRLAAVTEMGLKGVGTSFQYGIKNGLDPVGNIATRILHRAENPKDPKVMFEVREHIKGLEEIQQTYLDRGDIHLATKVQNNIDKLNALLGKTDKNNAVSEMHRKQDATNDVIHNEKLRVLAAKLDMNREVERNTGSKVDTLRTEAGRGLQRTADGIGTVAGKVDNVAAEIRNKDFSVDIYTTVVNQLRAAAHTAGGDFIPDRYGNVYHAGGWDVPGGPAMLSPGETVLPPKAARAFREMAKRGFNDGGGGDVIHNHVTVQGLMRGRTTEEIGSGLRRLGEMGQLSPKRRRRRLREYHD